MMSKEERAAIAKMVADQLASFETELDARYVRRGELTPVKERGEVLEARAPTATSGKMEAMAAKVIVAMQGFVQRALAPLKERIDVLEAREPTMPYKGVWRSEEQYARGELVTHGGSMWASKRLTRSRPGTEPESWTLAVKREVVKL